MIARPGLPALIHIGRYIETSTITTIAIIITTTITISPFSPLSEFLPSLHHHHSYHHCYPPQTGHDLIAWACEGRDPLTSQWTQLATLPTLRSNHSQVTIAIDTKVRTSFPPTHALIRHRIHSIIRIVHPLIHVLIHPLTHPYCQHIL